MNHIRIRTATITLSLAAMAFLTPGAAFAHCDTMDGPVVKAAQKALRERKVDFVLAWVQKPSETEIRKAFDRTLAVREKGAEAKELADQYFFETLVRIHRAGEGAPYTGLKPAGTDSGPAVEEADKALESGSVDKLVKQVTDETTAGIRKRFAAAHEKKAHAEHNVEAGRQFVAAYVDYVHYAEGVHKAAEGAGAHHGEGDTETAESVAHAEALPEHNH